MSLRRGAWFNELLASLKLKYFQDAAGLCAKLRDKNLTLVTTRVSAPRRTSVHRLKTVVSGATCPRVLSCTSSADRFKSTQRETCSQPRIGGAFHSLCGAVGGQGVQMSVWPVPWCRRTRAWARARRRRASFGPEPPRPRWSRSRRPGPWNKTTRMTCSIRHRRGGSARRALGRGEPLW
jgi:hypothetical protein